MEERVRSARLGECQTEATNLARQAGVDHLRSETHDETADQRCINAEVDVDLVGAGHGLHLLGKRRLLSLSEGLRRANLRKSDALLFAIKLKVSKQNCIKSQQPLTISQNFQKIQNAGV